VSKFLTLAEVDRLIDELDRSMHDADWRAPFERLSNGYMSARRVRNVSQGVLRPVVLVALLYFLMLLYTQQWRLDGLDRELQNTFLAIIILNALSQLIIFSIFPVLRREERVVSLLRAFGADIPDHDSDVGERLPPQVAVALETLEKANSPAGLRPAYEAVENWQFSAKGWTWNGVESALFWFVALVAAIFGGQLGVPDFFQGAAFMFVVMMAWLYITRLTRRGSIVRRVEEALGRWRHLVPAMHEAPP
jgi:hypothetical protein